MHRPEFKKRAQSHVVISRAAYAALAGMVGMLGTQAHAAVDVVGGPATAVNVPWQPTPTLQPPIIDTVDTNISDTTIDAPGNYTPLVPEGFVVNAQTFTIGATGFKLGQIAIISDGSGSAGANNFSLHLYELVPGTGGTSSLPGSYNPSTAGTGSSAAPDLLGGGLGIPLAIGASPNRQLQFQFTGADQVQLDAGKQYAFEIHRDAGASGEMWWYRVGGGTTLPPEPTTYGNPYPGGDAYNAATTPNTTLRTQNAGLSRDLMMAVYDTSVFPGFPMQVDINGGPSNHARPNQGTALPSPPPAWRPWGNVGSPAVLPSSGNGASPDPQGGYGSTPSISKEFGTSGLSSGTLKTTLKSVDIINSGGPVYNQTVTNNPQINTRDYSITGREFDSSGNFTPTKDALYRDVVIAERGAEDSGNGTSHRMEIWFEGLDPNTPYKLKFYAHDNSNQRSVQVFTDVTTQPQIFMPSAFSNEDDQFQEGDGSGATEYAPNGQYIIGPTDGNGQPIDPTYPVASDDFRAITLFATSDGGGKLVFAQTTVTGLAGATQTLPVLNGFELDNDNRAWGGGTGTNWNETANWNGGNVPNTKGQVANFGGTSNTTVTVDTATTVGRMNFGSSSMTINGPGVLTLDDTSINSTLSFQTTGRTQINLTSSAATNQTINANLQMNKDTQLSVSNAASTLTLNNLQPAAVVLTKVGAGTVRANAVRTNGLSVVTGKLELMPNGLAAGVSRSGFVFIGGTGTLDITNNKLITNSAVGTWVGSSNTYTGVTAQIALGRGTGTWNGASGIVTSQTNATNGSNYHSIGISSGTEVLLSRGLSATDTMVWAGQTISAADTLVMYTYGGDANLDGKLNIDDYVAADQGIAGGLTGWSNGDFNYDGKVNIDDYSTVIDSNIGNQVGVFFTGGGIAGESVSAVPEPATLGLLGLTLGTLALRRRRGK